jgi:uncharacterized iron-regulated membrane protein
MRNTQKSKNWLIAAFRKWHTWLGIGAALFILAAALSGIVLNHKKAVFAALGLEKEMPRTAREKSGQAARFSTETGFAAAAISPERVLAAARERFGDVPLERIELKHERGELVYKIKQTGGDELWVNADTGAAFVKNEYRKTKTGPGGVSDAGVDWGRLILDVHTGKIGGPFGKALMSAAALVLLFLTGSGVCLWLKPLLVRRRNAAAKRAPALQPNPILLPEAAVTRSFRLRAD